VIGGYPLLIGGSLRNILLLLRWIGFSRRRCQIDCRRGRYQAAPPRQFANVLRTTLNLANALAAVRCSVASSELPGLLEMFFG
jgi:hypothetical protein